MKKITKIFFASLLSVGFGIAAQAQSEDADIKATARIFDAITVAKVQDLQFGQIMIGTKKTVLPGSITPTSSDASGASAVGVQPGIFQVNAGAGASVSLSFGTMITTLARKVGTTGAALPISFTTDSAGEPTSLAAFSLASDLTGQTAFAANSGYNFDGASGRTLFPTNLLDTVNGIYVFIGGTVDAAGIPAGEFEGTITLSATYN